MNAKVKEIVEILITKSLAKSIVWERCGETGFSAQLKSGSITVDNFCVHFGDRVEIFHSIEILDKYNRRLNRIESDDSKTNDLLKKIYDSARTYEPIISGGLGSILGEIKESESIGIERKLNNTVMS
jgi:hypothetical protein